MNITRSRTVKEILAARPNAIEVLLQHGVDVPVECDESIHECELELCDSMYHIDDIDQLILDLQKFFDAQPVAEAS